jgi:hypothetical protein
MIAELFAPLGARLFELENLQETVVLDGDGTPSKPRIQEIMDTISGTVDRYESHDVIAKCKLYLKRIAKLKATLKVADSYQLIWFDVDNEEHFSKTVTRSKEEMKTALKQAHEGLDYCSRQLSLIVDNHKTSLPEDQPNPKTVVTEIKLPDNFTVKQLNVHFDPLLSLRQATLFLYYLREKGVIPNYNASELGRLGEVFFARNNKNIRQELQDIYGPDGIRQNAKELKALQEVLQSILHEIDIDLKKAR